METKRKGMTASERNWRRNNLHLQLRVERKLYDAMAKRARDEGMPLSAWVRFAAARELRRRKTGI
jgi:hypothetical protein